MKNILLVRHGQTELNAKNKLQGFLDAPLNDKGRASAERVRTILAPVPLSFAYCSDRLRAHMTAKLILAQREPAVTLQAEPLLREYYFGGLEGQPDRVLFQRMVQRYGLANTLSCWRKGTGFPRLIQGFATADYTKQADSLADLQARAQQILDWLAADPHEGNLLVVAHSVLLSMIIYQIAPNQLPHRLLKNASVSILTQTAQGWQPNGINLTRTKEIQTRLLEKTPK